jgi:hypothetical protein
MEGSKIKKLKFICKVRGKKHKIQPITCLEGPEDYKYSSPLFLTSSLDGGKWSSLRPSLFASGKEIRCTFFRSMGEPQGRCGRVQKISTLQRDSIREPSIPQRITILTELSRPTKFNRAIKKLRIVILNSNCITKVSLNFAERLNKPGHLTYW